MQMRLRLDISTDDGGGARTLAEALEEVAAELRAGRRYGDGWRTTLYDETDARTWECWGCGEEGPVEDFDDTDDPNLRECHNCGCGRVKPKERQ